MKHVNFAELEQKMQDRRIRHEEYVREYDKNLNNLYEIVSKYIGDSLDHLSEEHKKAQISRLAREFCNMGLCTEEDIRKVDKNTNRYMYNRIRGSRLSKMVVDNIMGVYDDVAAKKERLAKIDKEIARLNKERENILNKLNGGQ